MLWPGRTLCVYCEQSRAPRFAGLQLWGQEMVRTSRPASCGQVDSVGVPSQHLRVTMGAFEQLKGSPVKSHVL